MKKVTERANDLTYTGAMGFKGEMNKPKGRFFWFLISKGWQKTRPKINQKNRPFGLQNNYLFYSLVIFSICSLLNVFFSVKLFINELIIFSQPAPNANNCNEKSDRKSQ